jgi:hypothetical protein
MSAAVTKQIPNDNSLTGITTMKYTLIITGLCLLALSSLSTGCRQDPASPSDNIQSAEDNAVVESEFASVFEMVDDDATENPTFGKTTVVAALTPDCLTRTVETALRTITFDFGDTNCLCKDGMYRRGKVLAQFTGKYREIGSTVVITLQNYFVNGMQVNGTKTIERDGAAKFTVTVTGASMVTEEGTISWSAQRTVERIAGNGTLTPWDDVYAYTGSASGTNRQGKNFTVTIDEPLKKKIELGCLSNFVAGKLSIAVTGGATMTLDYDPIGGEPCDKIAQVTINGESRNIVLR